MRLAIILILLMAVMAVMAGAQVYIPDEGIVSQLTDPVGIEDAPATDGEIYIGSDKATTITTEDAWIVEKSFELTDVIINVTEPTLTIYLDAIIHYKKITQITITKDGKSVTLTLDELWERVKP